MTTCGWIAQAGPYAPHPPLAGAQTTDWLIIGGGFTGLSAAHELAARCPEARLLLIDARKIAQGAAARNSGFNVGYDLPGFARTASRAERTEYLAQTAIDRAGAEENVRLINDLGIDCDFRADGFTYAVHDPARFAAIAEQAEILRETGAEAILLDEADCRARYGTPFYRRGLHIGGGGNGTLQPAKFAKALLDRLPQQVETHEDTPALSLRPAPGGGAVIEVPGGTIRARRVILALNGYLPRFGQARHRMIPLTLTASLTRPLTPEEEDRIGHADPWAVLCPIKGGTTARLTADRRVLIRNTAEYRPTAFGAVDVAARRGAHLRGLQRRFPWLGADDIEFSWAGTMGGSRGYRFLFGESAPGVFLAACCNGNGVARLSMLGRLLVQMATGDQTPLLSTALSIGKPGLLPPDPLLWIGVSARFALDRHKAAGEV